MHYIFLLNHFAEKKRLGATVTAIYELKERLGDNVHIHETEYAGHAGALSVQYADLYESDAIIFSCGGDGTAHEVANAIAFRRTAMCVIPMGTGNDFARCVLSPKLYANPQEILRYIDKLEIRPIDLIRVDSYDAVGKHLPLWSRYSINITSFGLDTMVQSKAKRIVTAAAHWSLIRKQSYLIAVIFSLIQGWNFKMRYSFELADEKRSIDGEKRYCLASICNGQYYGNGFHPAPMAILDDGILEVCIADDISRWDFIRMVSKYKKGTHINHPKIHMYRVTSGVISSKDSHLQLSGNYEGEDFFGHQVRFEVIPKALMFAFIRDEENEPKS